MLHLEDTLVSVGNDKRVHFLDLSTNTEPVPSLDVSCALFDVIPFPYSILPHSFTTTSRSSPSTPASSSTSSSEDQSPTGFSSLGFSTEIATSGGDNNLYKWDLRHLIYSATTTSNGTTGTGSSRVVFPKSGTFVGHSRCTTQLEFLDQYDLLISGSRDTDIRVWRARSRDEGGGGTRGRSTRTSSGVHGGGGSPLSGDDDDEEEEGERVRRRQQRQRQRSNDSESDSDEEGENFCPCVGLLSGHTNFVSCVEGLGEIYPQKVVSGATDSTVRVWDVSRCLSASKSSRRSNFEDFPQMRLDESEGEGTMSSSSGVGDGGIGVVGGGATVPTIPVGGCVRVIHDVHDRPVRDLAHCSALKCCYAASWDKTVSVIDLQSFQKITKLVHGDLLYAVMVHPLEDNLLISGTTKGDVWFWDIRQPRKALGIFRAHQKRIFALEPITGGNCGHLEEATRDSSTSRIRFASTSDDNTVRVFSLTDSHLALMHYRMTSRGDRSVTTPLTVRASKTHQEEYRFPGKRVQCAPKEVCCFEMEKNQFGMAYLGPLDLEHRHRIAGAADSQNTRFVSTLEKWNEIDSGDQEEEGESQDCFGLSKALSMGIVMTNGSVIRLPRSQFLHMRYGREYEPRAKYPDVVNMPSADDDVEGLLNLVDERIAQRMLFGISVRKALIDPIPYYEFFSRLGLLEALHALCGGVQSLLVDRHLIRLAKRCLGRYECVDRVVALNDWIPNSCLTLAVFTALKRNEVTLQDNSELLAYATELDVLPWIQMLLRGFDLASHRDFVIDQQVLPYPLDWSQYCPRICRSLLRRSLMDSMSFTNVTVRTEDGVGFRAHLDVLVTRSEFFNRMLIFHGRELDTLRKKGEIVVQFFSATELRAILNFVYVGSLHVTNLHPEPEDSTLSFASVLRLIGHSFVYSERNLLRALIEELAQATLRLRQSQLLESTLEDDAYLLAEPNVYAVALPIITSPPQTGLSRSRLDVLVERSSRERSDSEMRLTVLGRLGRLETRVEGIEILGRLERLETRMGRLDGLETRVSRIEGQVSEILRLMKNDDD